jgi:hypothetical protein
MYSWLYRPYAYAANAFFANQGLDKKKELEGGGGSEGRREKERESEKGEERGKCERGERMRGEGEKGGHKREHERGDESESCFWSCSEVLFEEFIF